MCPLICPPTFSEPSAWLQPQTTTTDSFPAFWVVDHQVCHGVSKVRIDPTDQLKQPMPPVNKMMIHNDETDETSEESVVAFTPPPAPASDEPSPPQLNQPPLAQTKSFEKFSIELRKRMPDLPMKSLSLRSSHDSEASELPKGLVLDGGGHIHIRHITSSPLVDVGCYSFGFVMERYFQRRFASTTSSLDNVGSSRDVDFSRDVDISRDVDSLKESELHDILANFIADPGL
ncbi:hypothetical protein L3X38_011643 [Prunus dulcis]|uniref:Uncharacterized protein n=1 Tax=Prunus dulcis TaxID=3755 RepID=A0AAD4WK32_PRUDU|nr:hypothetical protein L3X38_011643 [Prunus dulcis]